MPIIPSMIDFFKKNGLSMILIRYSSRIIGRFFKKRRQIGCFTTRFFTKKVYFFELTRRRFLLKLHPPLAVEDF